MKNTKGGIEEKEKMEMGLIHPDPSPTHVLHTS